FFSSMHWRARRMDCQICPRRLTLSEPIYRGSRTSVCERCLYALIGTLRRPGLEGRFPIEPGLQGLRPACLRSAPVEGDARDLFKRMPQRDRQRTEKADLAEIRSRLSTGVEGLAGFGISQRRNARRRTDRALQGTRLRIRCEA